MKANKVNGVNQWKKRSAKPYPSLENGFMVLRVENWARYFRCRKCGHEFRLDVKGKVTVKAICPNPLCKNAKVVRGDVKTTCNVLQPLMIACNKLQMEVRL